MRWFVTSTPPLHSATSSLLASDGLNEYVKHVGSAIFAVPGGVAEVEFVGQRLFD